MDGRVKEGGKERNGRERGAKVGTGGMSPAALALRSAIDANRLQTDGLGTVDVFSRRRSSSANSFADRASSLHRMSRALKRHKRRS